MLTRPRRRPASPPRATPRRCAGAVHSSAGKNDPVRTFGIFTVRSPSRGRDELVAGAVALGRARVGALVQLGADVRGRLGVDQRLATSRRAAGASTHRRRRFAASRSTQARQTDPGPSRCSPFCEFLGRFSQSLTRWPLNVRDRHEQPVTIKGRSYTTQGDSARRCAAQLTGRADMHYHAGVSPRIRLVRVRRGCSVSRLLSPLLRGLPRCFPPQPPRQARERRARRSPPHRRQLPSPRVSAMPDATGSVASIRDGSWTVIVPARGHEVRVDVLSVDASTSFDVSHQTDGMIVLQRSTAHERRSQPKQCGHSPRSFPRVRTECGE